MREWNYNIAGGGKCRSGICGKAYLQDLNSHVHLAYAVVNSVVIH